MASGSAKARSCPRPGRGPQAGKAKMDMLFWRRDQQQTSLNALAWHLVNAPGFKHTAGTPRACGRHNTDHRRQAYLAAGWLHVLDTKTHQNKTYHRQLASSIQQPRGLHHHRRAAGRLPSADTGNKGVQHRLVHQAGAAPAASSSPPARQHSHIAEISCAACQACGSSGLYTTAVWCAPLYNTIWR